MKNALTKEAFADFCTSKPASEQFCIYRVENCAVAQFARSLGFVSSWPDFTIDAGAGRALKIEGVTPDIMCTGNRTFGALAQRLRSA